MRVSYLLFADKVTKDEEPILHFGFEPGRPSLDRLAQVVSIGHIQQEHVSTNPIHPWVLSAQPIEDHAELDLMHDIIRTGMVRDLKLCPLR